MTRLLVALVRGYQLLLSPWIGGQCRFTPTCSEYTLQSLRRFGAARGSYLGIVRIARCHPWCRGGHEPVPKLFRWDSWHRDEAADEAPDRGTDRGTNRGTDSD